MKKLLLGFLAAACALLASAALISQAAAKKDPFIGVWYSTDTDGSNQSLTIGGGRGATYHVRYFDDGATVCGLGPAGEFLYAASARGSLAATTVDTIEGNLPVYCLKTPPTLFGASLFRYMYQSSTHTLLDLHGVVWHR